jgi:hypothetical protein
VRGGRGGEVWCLCVWTYGLSDAPAADDGQGLARQLRAQELGPTHHINTPMRVSEIETSGALRP